MQITETKRNSGFDFLRYVCAFLVISIHTQYFGKEYAMLFARAAVPIFFMITGYFYTSVSERGRHIFQIRKILIITVLSNLVYIIWELLSAMGSSGGIHTKFLSWIDASLWLNVLLTNDSPFRSHLWYLSALLYVLLIALFIKNGRKKLYFLIPVLLGINLLLGNYSTLIFGKTLPLAYSRNFLFLGLPCFLLGDLIYQRRNAAQPGNRVLLLILSLSLVVSFSESFLLTRLGMYQNQDLSLGNIATAYAVFSLVKNNPAFFEHSLCKRIARMGKDLSLGIYICHAIIRTFTEMAIAYTGRLIPVINAICYYSMPLIMLIVDSCAVFILLWVMKKLKKH